MVAGFDQDSVESLVAKLEESLVAKKVHWTVVWWEFLMETEKEVLLVNWKVADLVVSLEQGMELQ